MADDAGRTAAGPLRLAEVVAALSLATDLGTGQPLEHALRTCLLSLELARRSEVGADELQDVYYVALLRFIGCTSDSADTAAMAGGDDLRFLAAMAPAFMGSPAEQVRVLAREVGVGRPPLRRVAALGSALTDAKGTRDALAGHCEAGQMLSLRLGVSPGITRALGQAYERWDGKGLPAGVAGEELSSAVRVAIVARDVDALAAITDLDGVVDAIRRRSGKAYDPQVAGAFVNDPRAVLSAVTTHDAWQAVLDAEPAPWIRVHHDQLATALGALGDFADLKSPWLRGHSPAVAGLAGDAAAVAGLDEADIRAVHLAGLVHDLGRVGVPNGIWDHPGPLATSALEKVRIHPYLTERILSRSRSLAPLARLAASHHERCDGSGYYRGTRTPELGAAERILGAADMYAALTQDRPHRPAVSGDEACAVLRDGAGAGTFAASDVEAVAQAAGHPTAPGGDERPAGLTEREVEVLRLIARGRSNREVAAELVISPKTVGSHVEHIYAKAGVTTRAGVALFAMEQRLL